MENDKKKLLNLRLGDYLCNNNCIFCADGEKKNLPLPKLKEIFETLKKWRQKTDSLVFCGSDPTLNPYFLDTIKKAKELNYSEIRLITNGRLLSYFDFAKKIVESGVTEICISFHGSCPKIQDAQTRVPGSFKQTLKACRNLSILKPAYKFKWSINYTFNKLNAPDLYNFFKLIISFDGLDTLNISAVTPSGRALEYFDIVMPNYADLGKIFQKTIKKLQKNSVFKKRLESGFDFRITGIPFCVMKGYENYIGDYKDLYLLKNPLDKKINTFYKELKHEQVMGPHCKNCCYYKTCSGIWKKYIKRRGWKEFKPVKK